MKICEFRLRHGYIFERTKYLFLKVFHRYLIHVNSPEWLVLGWKYPPKSLYTHFWWVGERWFPTLLFIHLIIAFEIFLQNCLNFYIWKDTIKIELSVMVENKADIVISWTIFSLWFSWKCAHLTLRQHSLLSVTNDDFFVIIKNNIRDKT
jgi:hypothetical protein